MATETCFVLTNHKGPTGVPLGGIGAGSFQLSPEGHFTRIALNNIQRDTLPSPPGFCICVHESSPGESGDAVRLQRDDTAALGMTGCDQIRYCGLFPTAALEFSSRLSCRISLEAYSGLIPNDLQLSTLPAAFFELTIENTQAQPAVFAAAFSWGDILGRGIKDQSPTLLPQLPNGAVDYLSVNGEHWPQIQLQDTGVRSLRHSGYRGLVQETNGPLVPQVYTYQNYNTHCALLWEEVPECELSLLPSYEAGEDHPEWLQFASSGCFSQSEDIAFQKLSDADGPPHASALSVRFRLGSRQKKTVRFLVAWFADEIQPPKGGDPQAFFPTADYNKYYHNFSHSLEDVIAVAAQNRDQIRAGIREWQQPILDSSLPEWLKFKWINAAYPLYSNTVLTKGKAFTVIEGAMGGLGGTMDQKMCSHPACQKLFFELDQAENELFAVTRHQNGGILHYILNYYGAIANFDGSSPVPEGQMMDNSGAWILQLAKNVMQTGDRLLLEHNRQAFLDAIGWLFRQADNPSHIPIAPTTYDNHEHPEVFVFSASVYGAVLLAAGYLFDALALPERADDCRRRLELVRSTLNALYQPKRGFYAIGCSRTMSDMQQHLLFSGQLAGQFLSSYCGWGDLVAPTDYTKLETALDTMLQTVVSACPDYYSAKIWDVDQKTSLDMPGSQCWPFYLESYTAMLAIRLGRIADGLAIMEHIQSVHLNNGWEWTQNLWFPGPINYMTAPVTWFIGDVLAGIAFDVCRQTLQISPVLLPGTPVLKLPLFFPRFCAVLHLDSTARTCRLHITSVLKNDALPPIRFRTLLLNRANQPACLQHCVTLNPAFEVREGQSLDLSPYYPLFAPEGRERGALLTPVPPYVPGETFIWGNGTGLTLTRYPDPECQTPLCICPHTGSVIAGDPHSDTAVLTGQVQPKYSNAYRFFMSDVPGVQLRLAGRLLPLEQDPVHASCSTAFQALKAGEKYDIELRFPGRADMRLEWQSTLQTREPIPQSQLYSECIGKG